jgi:DNA (cytosine-5)-methyltransferase 1
MKLRTVDIFSGCGGLSLGFQNSGFNIVSAYDNWDLAISTYKMNFDHQIHNLDLSQITDSAAHIQKHSPNVLIGGPPCQDFSIAGNRVESDRANLTVAFSEIVALVKPQIVIMENVYNISKSIYLAHAVSNLKASGYGITTRIINASYIGVPQMRKRFFLVAALGVDDDVFGSNLDKNQSSERTTVADYFGDSLGTEFYYAHPRSYNRRAVFSIHEPSATIRRVNRPIPATYQKHAADKAEISPAVRPLTTEERAQIQTFPRSFKFSGSRTQQEHLIANAVPVSLARYVADQVVATLKEIKYC